MTTSRTQPQTDCRTRRLAGDSISQDDVIVLKGPSDLPVPVGGDAQMFVGVLPETHVKRHEVPIVRATECVRGRCTCLIVAVR